jgi:hypothetical protein
MDVADGPVRCKALKENLPVAGAVFDAVVDSEAGEAFCNDCKAFRENFLPEAIVASGDIDRPDCADCRSFSEYLPAEGIMGFGGEEVGCADCKSLREYLPAEGATGFGGEEVGCADCKYLKEYLPAEGATGFGGKEVGCADCKSFNEYLPAEGALVGGEVGCADCRSFIEYLPAEGTGMSFGSVDCKALNENRSRRGIGETSAGGFGSEFIDCCIALNEYRPVTEVALVDPVGNGSF